MDRGLTRTHYPSCELSAGYPEARCTCPQRIQLQRTKGWRNPDRAVIVARPSKWGNTFIVGEDASLSLGDATLRFTVRDREHAVALYANWQAPQQRHAAQEELAGRDLACWCPLKDSDDNYVPCHADVLLDLANQAP